MPLFNFDTFDIAAQREELARQMPSFREWNDSKVINYGLKRALELCGDAVLHVGARSITLRVMGSNDFDQQELMNIVSGCLHREGRDYHFRSMGVCAEMEYDYGCSEGSPTAEIEFIFEVR